MIRMNEIFMCLTCYGQKLIIFFCLEIETRINRSSEKGSSEDDIRTISLENDIYDTF